MSALAAVLNITDQSTTSDEDYIALIEGGTDTVTFASGELEKDVALTIIADTDVEGDEQFLVSIISVSEAGHQVDELYQTTVVIADQDTPGKPS